MSTSRGKMKCRDFIRDIILYKTKKTKTTLVRHSRRETAQIGVHLCVSTQKEEKCLKASCEMITIDLQSASQSPYSTVDNSRIFLTKKTILCWKWKGSMYTHVCEEIRYSKRVHKHEGGESPFERGRHAQTCMSTHIHTNAQKLRKNARQERRKGEQAANMHTRTHTKAKTVYASVVGQLTKHWFFGRNQNLERIVVVLCPFQGVCEKRAGRTLVKLRIGRIANQDVAWSDGIQENVSDAMRRFETVHLKTSATLCGELKQYIWQNLGGLDPLFWIQATRANQAKKYQITSVMRCDTFVESLSIRTPWSFPFRSSFHYNRYGWMTGQLPWHDGRNWCYLWRTL